MTHSPKPDRADDEKAAAARTAFVIAAWSALPPKAYRQLFSRQMETELAWATRWRVSAPSMVDYARYVRAEYAVADKETRQQWRRGSFRSHYRIGVPPSRDWLAELERLDGLPDWRLSDKVLPTADDEHGRRKLADDADLLARPGLNPAIETDEQYMQRAAAHCRARRLRFQRFVPSGRPQKASSKLHQHVQWLVRQVVGGETITAIAQTDDVNRQAVSLAIREVRRLVQLKSRPPAPRPQPRKI